MKGSVNKHHREHVLEDLRRAVTGFSVEVWRDALGLARQLRAESVFANALGVVPQGLAISQEIGAKTVPSKRLALQGASLYFDQWAQTTGRRTKLKLAMAMLVPSKSFIINRWPFAQKGGPALIAAYVWHVARIVVRAPSALKIRLNGRHTECPSDRGCRSRSRSSADHGIQYNSVKIGE